jgi:hypothetical protein
MRCCEMTKKCEEKEEGYFDSERGYKIEYAYDQDGNKVEVGPSFMDVPGGSVVTSCPICRACMNQINDVEKWTITCKVRGEIPDEIGMRKTFECEYYIPNPESYDYELVQKLMRGEKTY